MVLVYGESHIPNKMRNEVRRVFNNYCKDHFALVICTGKIFTILTGKRPKCVPVVPVSYHPKISSNFLTIGTVCLQCPMSS